MQSEIEQIKRETDSSLLLSKDRIERIFQGIEQLSLQLSIDPLITNSFLDAEFPNKTLEHIKVLQAFNVTKNANDFIDDIIFYDGSADYILSNEYGNIKKEWYRNSAILDEIRLQNKQAQWTYIPNRQNGSLAFIRYLPVNKAGQPRGLFLITIKSSLVQKYLESPIHFTTKLSMLVLDPQGQMLLNDGAEYAMGESFFISSPIKSIINAEESANSFFAKDENGSQYLYTFRKTAFGRIYISKVAEDAIGDKITWIRWYTILVVLIFLIVGVLMTLITSIKVYNPIKQLISYSSKLSEGRVVQRYGNEFAFIRDCLNFFSKEAETLERDKEKLEPTIKERFYQQLVEEKYLNQQLLNDNSHIFSVPVQNTYVVLVVTLGEFYKETRFTASDGPIVTYIIRNVMNELLDSEKTLNGDIIHDSKGRGVAILHASEDLSDQEITESLRRFSETIRSSMQDYLQISVAVGIGRVYSHIRDVPISYNEALLALQYRIYRENDSILMIQELEHHRKPSPFYYPLEIETIIVEALNDGNLSEAEIRLKEFMKGVRSSESYKTISQCYHMLLASIISSLAAKPWVSFLEILDHHLFDQLKERQTPAEINDWFVFELFPLYQKLTDKTRTANSLVNRVCSYIKEHVNGDISLVQCSELIAVNPSYLSRLFKKEMGTSFLDYVLQCKVEEAKRLISETNLNNSEIAEAIGYSERNLIRVFQKFTHMTPGHYRTMQRNSQSAD
jgi:AraC-like DNA-binding protein